SEEEKEQKRGGGRERKSKKERERERKRGRGEREIQPLLALWVLFEACNCREGGEGERESMREGQRESERENMSGPLNSRYNNVPLFQRLLHSIKYGESLSS